MKIKYCTTWIIGLIFVYGSIICTIWFTYEFSHFDAEWIKTLKRDKESLMCSSDSLWIDVDLIYQLFESSETTQDILII